MALHRELRTMPIEAIDEYLALVEYGTTARKADGGIYGYPSVLLLFSVIDALSNYAGHTENTLRELQSIFPGLTKKQVQDLKRWYRNLPSHQAIVMPGTVLSPEETGTPIECNSAGEPTLIRVIPLYRTVKGWWETFDKSRISPKFQKGQAPKNPII
jgi:hypothetical protein